MQKLFALCLTLFLLTSCTPGEGLQDESQTNNKPSDTITDNAESSDHAFTAENFPLIDGSTSNQPLRQMIACEKLGVECEWGERRDWEIEESIEHFIVPTFFNEENDIQFWFSGGNLINIAEESLDSLSEEEKEIVTFWREKLPNTKTHGAWVKLIDGEVDLIFTATKPSDDEMELAKEKGVEFETKAIALDAFVFIANSANPTENVTQQQIRDVFSGETDNWSKINPDHEEEILALTRNRNSGSQEAMEKIVMKDVKMSPDLMPMTMPTMGGTINRVADEPNSLCYTFYFYQKFIIPNPSIKLMSVDGFEPNSENIASKKYPFTTEVYATVRTDLDKSSNAYKLFEWLLTDEGQEVVAKSGYVPI